MKQLTDSMIESSLQSTWDSGDNILMLVILFAIVIFLGIIFLFSKSTRQKIGAGGTIILFIILALATINQENAKTKAIKNGTWEVHTDVVDRVMVSTDDDGDKDYFMVLETYGRISLDSYTEASQYYTGQTVYIVVIPNGRSFEKTGIVYPTDAYIYVGNH